MVNSNPKNVFFLKKNNLGYSSPMGSDCLGFERGVSAMSA